MLEKRDMEGVNFDVDWMTRCVAGKWQAGESISVSVLVRVLVLDTVPMSSEEQGIPLQTSGSHGRQVLLRVEDSGCNIPNFDSKHSDTFFSVLVFLQSRHKQIPKKHHINTVSTSHISHTHITFTRNAADHNITQSVLTRCHLSQSIVRPGKMLSITILPP